MWWMIRGWNMSKPLRRYRRAKPVRPRFVYVSNEGFRVERITAKCCYLVELICAN